MQSPTMQEQPHRQTQGSPLNPPAHDGLNPGIDTGWFLKHEEDQLAGYLFTQDYEVREGSD